jgi:hypothetical protein
MEHGFGSGASGKAQTAVTVSTAATEGDLASNQQWRELLGPAGAGDDLLAPWSRMVCAGLSWTWAESAQVAGSVLRTPPLSRSWALPREGLRASSRPDEEPDEAGALILDRDFGIAASTEAAWRWIDRLGLKQPSEEEPLPAFMYPALRPSAGRACRKLEATFDSYRDIEVTLTTQG